MFRDIRKKKNKMSAELTNKLLKETRIGILAVNGDEGYPYALPINFLYDEARQKIFFHGAKRGHKYDALKRSEKVCFSVYGQEMVKEEAWAPFVQSAVIFGRCHLLENTEQALEVLKQFALKYYPNEKMVMDEIDASRNAVQLFEIDIEQLSGKEVQEK